MNQNFSYSIRLKLCAEDKFFGPGTVTLLREVDQTHSLSAASKQMSLSYSKAIAMIKNAEKQLGFPLLLSKIGGASGGGSELTSQARAVIQLYEQFESQVKACADDHFKTLRQEIEKLQ